MTTDTADQVMTEALDDLREYADLRKQSYTIANDVEAYVIALKYDELTTAQRKATRDKLSRAAQDLQLLTEDLLRAAEHLEITTYRMRKEGL